MGSGISSRRVFVGIPTYNRPEMLRETVESLRHSTLGDFRAVISDNQSAPDAAASVEAFVKDLGDDRFGFVQQPENGGEYGQGRYFFREAGDAEYFMILHDDDLLDPEYLARAVETLDNASDAALFVANPRLIDEAGACSSSMTDAYHREHGRKAYGRGLFPILDSVLESGFAPISGTLFRQSALVRSGFVDDDCFGNFPFELNVMLRLGDLGAKGWFEPDTLMSVRYHRGSLRNTLGLMKNPEVVETMLRLLERRSYAGRPETRRRAILSRLHRANAEMALERGDVAAARRHVAQACRAWPRSFNAWKTRLKMALIPS